MGNVDSDNLNRILQDSRPASSDGNQKKHMRAKDCIERYSLGRTKLVELAREFGAVLNN